MVPRPAETILDIGCGKGAALKALGGHGIGIEHNPIFAEEAKRNNPEAQIWQEDAKACLDVIAAIPDLILCLGASQAIGTPAEALARFAKIAPAGGYILFGDGYWRQTPGSEYLTFLSAEESDMGTFTDCIRLGEEMGLEAKESRETTDAEWAAYEESYQQAVLDWCRANPDDPEASAFEARIKGWRDAYLRWGKDTLGFGIHLFRKV